MDQHKNQAGSPPIVYIDSPELLGDCLASLTSVDRLCVDTEFVRTRTYYPNLGLVQVSDGQTNFIIDVPALDDGEVERLKDCLYNAKELVFYACSEDLEVFLRVFGSLPPRFYDLQIGLSLLGEEGGQGFARAVENHLGVTLAKSQTLTDWLKRPLTQEQLRYAADDVEYLAHLADKLLPTLEAQGKKTWLVEEATLLNERCLAHSDARHVHLRAKGLDRLNHAQTKRLIALLEWREIRAQTRNLPRGFVLKDPALYELAKRAPSSVDAIADISGINPERSPGIIEVLNDLLHSDATMNIKLPDFVPTRSPKDADLKKLKAELVRLADDANISATLITRKKELERFLYVKDQPQHPLYPQWLYGWRSTFFSEANAVLASAS